MKTTQYQYENRDISWLQFNQRVLQEAADLNNPLYERIKFLAIFSSNLDEFFKVRISKLRQLKKVDKKIRKRLALKPNKELKRILKKVDALQEEFGAIFREQIVPELKREHICLLESEQYEAHQKAYLTELFKKEILPHTVILEDVDTDSFQDGKIYLCLEQHDSDVLTFITVPVDKVGRFVHIPSDNETFYCTWIEDIVKTHVHLLIKENNIKSIHNIKISRDAELYLDNEYSDELQNQIYESLSQREDGQTTRLLYEEGMSPETQKRLRDLLKLGEIDLVAGGTHHNFTDFLDFPVPPKSDALQNQKLQPLRHPDFDLSENLFDLIKEKDRLLHFPYHSFSHLEDLVELAANDLAVTSIKISLYRIAKSSKLTSSLLRALTHNKEVVIFVEAKARFDEANNIKWGKKFEKRGGKVFYSFPNIKVHSKIFLISRTENGEQKEYGYIGTGNFNAKTAEIYCDHGLFTANTKITSDLFQVFKVLEGAMILPKLKNLIVSPFNSRDTFEKLIINEITNAQEGHPAAITAKMNSLEDKKIIELLYKASQAGVQVRLLVRGFCCLVPGITGMSDNIMVTSIVDRFLEHGRIYLFHNNGDEKMYMGSADWMTRNLDRRIEVLTPILDSDMMQELKSILLLQLSDNVKARIIDQESTNRYVGNQEQKKIRSQYEIYDFIVKKKSVAH